MRNNYLIKIGFVSFLLIGLSIGGDVVSRDKANTAHAQSTSFIFTAQGDIGSNSRADSVLRGVAASGAAFNLAVGDMSYNNVTPESAWCKYVTDRVGTTFPFELLAGNHESGGLNGLIDNFATCLPDKMGNISGTYAKEYYFDYPATNPLVRVIMVSPGLSFTNGGSYSYAKGTAHYNWTSSTIDAARTAGIPWVVVGNHKNCLTVGTKSCEITADFMNLMVSKKVDLVLQGHDHTYQRSKQLALNTTTCTAVAAGSYNGSCVANDGASNNFTKGAGTIFVINGAGGAGLYSVNTSDSEAGYFSKWMGSNINPTWGYSKFTVTATQISAQFVPTSGTLTDSFTLSTTSPPPPPPADTTPPSQPTNLAAAVVSSTQINLSWTASTDNVAVTGYKVYRNGAQVATATSNSYSDLGLLPSTAYSYYVVATDFFGNNSTPSNTVSATTQAPPCPTLPTDKGTATLTVNVTTAGTYRVWSRIMGAGDGSNSYYLQVDSSCGVVVGDLAGMTPNAWTWVDYQDGSATTKTSVNLTAGTHTLKLIGREAGLKLDNVILTTDTACVPTGDGTNCQPDTTKPVVSIVSPTNNATVSGIVPIIANATDDRGVVSRVEVRLDNVLFITMMSSPFSVNWNSAGVPNGTHTLQLAAVDPSGNVGLSDPISITVNNGDKTPPSVTLTSPASGAIISGSNVTLSANASDDGSGIYAVEFYVDQTLIGYDRTSPYSVALNSTTIANGTHSVTATASDLAGNSGSDTVTISIKNSDSTPPSTPAGLTATAPAYNQVKLTWTASTDNVGVSGYWVVRNGVTIGSSTTNSYTDNAVTEKTTYSYQVIAYDAAANLSGLSNTASVTTPSTPDTSTPTAPSGLIATAVGSSQVNLSWTASTDNIGVTGYDIYRNDQKLLTVTTTSYGDTGLTASTSYSYFVKARDAAGNVSGISNIVTVQTSTITQTLQLILTDDAYIDRSHTTTVYGSKTTLQVDKNPIQDYLMKFTVSGVGGKQIVSAKLRLYCANYSKVGGNFYRVANSAWSEKTVNWSNAPAADTTKFTSIANASKGKWYEVDLKPLVTGDGTFSLRVGSTSPDAAWYTSKEGTNKPQLVITTQ